MPNQTITGFPELTPRETEVAMEILRGKEPHEIAEALGINKRTYDTHRGQVMKKLGVKNVAQLMRLAMRRNCLPAVNS